MPSYLVNGEVYITCVSWVEEVIEASTEEEAIALATKAALDDPDLWHVEDFRQELDATEEEEDEDY